MFVKNDCSQHSLVEFLIPVATVVTALNISPWVKAVARL